MVSLLQFEIGAGEGNRTLIPHDTESREIVELENEIRDLQITNKANDIVIDRMHKERDGFFEQLLTANRKMGELETKLMWLESPETGVN